MDDEVINVQVNEQMSSVSERVVDELRTDALESWLFRTPQATRPFSLVLIQPINV